MGHLRWNEERFWASSPYLFNAEYDGWLERHGVKQVAEFGHAELEELMKRYPDTPPEIQLGA